MLERPINLEVKAHEAQGYQNRVRYPQKQETEKELRMLRQMMARSSWLLYRDFNFVKSVSQQLEEGRRTVLSRKQAKVIREIHRRWRKNQEPHFVQGGSPGGGKRR